MTIMGTVRLAAVVYDAGFGIDDFLTRVADRLHADRINIAGAFMLAGSAANALPLRR
jgi:hypothetical protein